MLSAGRQPSLSDITKREREIVIETFAVYVCKSTARKGGKENPQKFHREEKKEKTPFPIRLCFQYTDCKDISTAFFLIGCAAFPIEDTPWRSYLYRCTICGKELAANI